jgi:hypothetical protein
MADPTDILHGNSVMVLSSALAPRFPLFKAGQVLISLRSPSVLAVVDVPSRSVVWAAKSVWQNQHSAEFLENGHILLYDNSGSSEGTRILEYDPVTQAITWHYPGDTEQQFVAMFRGVNQRLVNGNTMFVDPSGFRIVEVTPAKEVVWHWGRPPCRYPSRPPSSNYDSPNITGARRLRSEELPFLRGVRHVRPK